ncbi:MAG: hypothetical protein WC683_12760 [bacterium]
MSIKIAGIDITLAVVNLEVQLKTTQNILTWLMANNGDRLTLPSSDILKEIRKTSLETIQKKYPDAGIKEINNATKD